MNDNPQPNSPLNPPPIPPIIGAHEFAPTDQVPLSSASNAVDSLLRHPKRVLHNLFNAPSRPMVWLLATALLCSLVFGFIMGTFSGGTQLWAAPVKLSATLFLSALICLPSLYIFSCLVGARIALSGIVGLVVGLLSLVTILLVGFAPVAWVFSQSTQSLPVMGFLYLVFAILALGFGLRFFWLGVQHMRAQSRSPFNVWIIILVLVSLQTTTALRPILGKSDTFLPTEKKFFLSHWMDVLDKHSTPSNRYDKARD